MEMKFEFGDRLFWGILIFIGAIFLWLGILERFAPIWIGAVVGFIAGGLFIFYGPGERAESEKGAKS